MGEAISLKYRAFLSYSHKDAAWAKWLHRRLEGFKINKVIVGRATVIGTVPATLRPVFRDRDDFSGGGNLTNATIEALDSSAALIVLCSAASAKQPAVNEEIRLFRSRHPERPVIPVIIDKTYPENYPPSLRFEIAANGDVTDRPVTILGPDLRTAADGRRLGLAKLVAGLTGIGPAEIFRWYMRDRRRRLISWIAGLSGIVITLATLVVYA